MSDYEQKAIDTTQSAAFDPQVLSDMVDTAARRNRVMDNVLAETHDRTDEAGSVFEVRERGTLDVQTQPENTEISTEDISYSTVEIGVDKYGESVVLTEEAREDGRDVDMDGIAEELGEAFANSQDQTAYDTLVGNGSVDRTALTSAGQLTRDELVDLRTTVRANKYEADSFVVHPSLEGEMLKIDGFIEADKYGDDANVRTGEMGRVLGATVYSSVTANDQNTTGGSGVAQVVAIDSEACLHRVVKRDITVKITEEERFDRRVAVGTARWGHGVVNPGAAAILES